MFCSGAGNFTRKRKQQNADLLHSANLGSQYMIYFRDFSLHSSSKRSQRKHPLLWLLLWWEQCLKLLSVCVWKKPWWRSDTTMLGLSDRPWTILAQWHPCQNSSLNLLNVFTLERLWSLYTTWHMALLTATLQHVTSCFSLFTHCENSACASKAANREKKNRSLLPVHYYEGAKQQWNIPVYKVLGGRHSSTFLCIHSKEFLHT